MKRLILLLAICGISLSLLARKDSIAIKRIYQIEKISGTAPLIDGLFSDEVWNQAEWTGDFTQHQPYSGKTPSFDTRFKICHDEDYIYVAIESFDSSPDSIVRRMTRRDDLDGDLVFLDFDSYHDLKTAFAFAVTAGGVKGDFLISNNGQSEDETWDPIWWVKTSLTKSGWLAEMKIPFSQLRFDNSGDGIWGLQVGRSIYRYDELSFWEHIPADAPGMIHLFGEMHGMKGVKPRKQAEIIPYLTSGIKRYEADSDNPFLNGKATLFNAGVDAKIGITNNLTLDLSLNPDFGQVEADPSEVNLSAYESFYEEKRPLFIEGKNIYNFPLRFGDGGMGAENLFYSRRIGRRPHHYPDLATDEYVKMPEQTNIIAAAKLSGKTKNGTSIGIIESVTAEEFATIQLGDEPRKISVEPLTNYFVARVAQDMNDGNTIIGGIATSTYRDINDEHLNFLPVSATTGGFDVQQFWGNKGYNIKFVNYVSHIAGTEDAITELQKSPSHLYQRPDADYVQLDTSRTSLTGFGGNLQFWKTSGNLNLLGAVVWKSPGLEINDLGFFRMGDEIMDLIWAGYNFYEPFSVFRRVHLNMDIYQAWDFGGNLAVAGLEAGAMSVFKNFWQFNYHFNANGNSRYNSFLRGGPSIKMPGSSSMSAFLSTDDRKKLVLEPSFRMEKGFKDHELRSSYSLEFEYRPFNALNLSVEPEYSKSFSMFQYVSQFEQQETGRYIFASIDQTVLALSLRANLTLSPELTIQYWGQPFLAVGDYHDFKYITNGLSDDFYDRFHLYDINEITPDDVENTFIVREESSGLDEYTIDNPDFHVKEFLSNLVIRWEYRPGSYIYAVWSQSRNGYDPESSFNFGKDVPAIWNIEPTNVFLLKFSYRLGR
ncbi:MAG: DUF5916 domain-containing protein [Bacteroidales bacterium]|jgi:hypothetical protein|nr:DUF5916 domain-containing protein [Bacteroidales bacterium]